MDKKKILPAIKKDIKHFLLSEEAKMSKKSIAKIGMGLTMLGVMLNAGTAAGQTHSSSFFNEPAKGGHSSHAAHASHASHSSHASHGSHSAHGSHGSHGSHSAHGSHASHSSHASHGSHTSHASHGAHGSHGSHGQW